MRFCILGRGLPKDMGFEAVGEHHELRLGEHLFFLALRPDVASQLVVDFLLCHHYQDTEIYERFRKCGRLVILTTGGEAKFSGSGIPVIGNRPSVRSLLQLNWDGVPADFAGDARQLVCILLPGEAQVAQCIG